ncbi:MAG: L,D-transpeptidase [Methyloceanibacter sp.]|uniref:L,D-transpeptidase n=1 Tax=Methyloceanibacter sp. TaxID=1965321 RepID=UPI003D6D51D2
MRLLGLASAVPAAAAILFALMPGEAVAGLFDVFGSSYQAPRVAGRQLVSFPPGYQPGTILVQLSQRRLYFVLPQQRAISYPIGAPTGDARWSGESYVSEKRINPDWRPTAEMRRENPTLPAFVPGGHPRNPLGVRAMYLGQTTYRIHGTDAPWTVGQDVSHGCIRMFNEDVADLYQRVPIGTRVVVMW